MYTIALVNQKGGSGKSTFIECLAVAAHLDKKSVAILDLDPQGSAYKWSKRREDCDPVVLSVTPANCLDELERMKNAGADFVFLDTPARLEENTSEAIKHADLVIIPAKATMKDLERVGASYDLVTKISETKSFVVFNQVRAQGDRAEQSRAFLEEKGIRRMSASFWPVCSL